MLDVPRHRWWSVSVRTVQLFVTLRDIGCLDYTADKVFHGERALDRQALLLYDHKGGHGAVLHCDDWCAATAALACSADAATQKKVVRTNLFLFTC